jgi:hypothetical protein
VLAGFSGPCTAGSGNYKLFVPEAADAHVYASFPQLGDALYTSGYSQFMWAKVIAAGLLPVI